MPHRSDIYNSYAEREGNSIQCLSLKVYGKMPDVLPYPLGTHQCDFLRGSGQNENKLFAPKPQETFDSRTCWHKNFPT